MLHFLRSINPFELTIFGATKFSDDIFNLERILHVAMENRVRPRFFDQVGHQTTNASIGNMYFFTK